jgi:hypothetical protein
LDTIEHLSKNLPPYRILLCPPRHGWKGYVTACKSEAEERQALHFGPGTVVTEAGIKILEILIEAGKED